MSGLQEKFEGNVNSRIVNATTPESTAAVKKLGFDRHGLVIRAADGAPLFRQADHTVDMEQVEEVLTGWFGT